MNTIKSRKEGTPQVAKIAVHLGESNATEIIGHTLVFGDDKTGKEGYNRIRIWNPNDARYREESEYDV